MARDARAGATPDSFDLAHSRAPVTVAFEVDAGASVAEAWAALTAVERWPLWHPGIDFAVLRGGSPSPGARLDWRADGMRIRSVVTEATPPAGVNGVSVARLEWTLVTLGGRGAQRWTVEPIGPDALGGGVPKKGAAGPSEDGPRVRIRLEEWWSGVTPRLLRRTLQRTLEVARTAWLARLRTRLESPPSHAPRSPAEVQSASQDPEAGPGHSPASP